MRDDLKRTITEIMLPNCLHCGSRYCGPYRCRFSDDHYADNAIRREKETPRWLRELRQGAKDE